MYEITIAAYVIVYHLPNGNYYLQVIIINIMN